MGDDPVRPAVQHGVDRVVDGAEVRRLDLHDVGGRRPVEHADVVDRVGPFVGHHLGARATLAQRGAQAGQRGGLGVARAGVEWVLHAQRQRPGGAPPWPG